LLAKRLFHALTRLVRTYQFRDRERVGYHGVTVTQVYALEIVARREPLTVGELAEELGLDKSTASRVVDAMSRAGLVQRAVHPSDGRALALSLTDSGLRTYRGIEADIVSEVARVLRAVSPGSGTDVARFIETLADAVQARPVLRNDPVPASAREARRRTSGVHRRRT
jgi:DNA-binding MarR family transcriptional regulator